MLFLYLWKAIYMQQNKAEGQQHFLDVCVGLSNIQDAFEGYILYYVRAVLIIAIIQSFRAVMAVGEAAGHLLILLEPLNTERTW